MDDETLAKVRELAIREVCGLLQPVPNKPGAEQLWEAVCVYMVELILWRGTYPKESMPHCTGVDSVMNEVAYKAICRAEAEVTGVHNAVA